MLRNPQSCKYLLKTINNQNRLFHLQNGPICDKNSTNAFRQGKIMGKLFGNRLAGSKKRWFPVTDAAGASANVVFKQSPFGKPTVNGGGGGKNASRRVTVLNKLFMKHITDLMATGEISENILGKGLQVSRVKISQDFAYVNVFWVTTGDVTNDVLLEKELHRCSGLLRHELSQLGLMGVVPRIKFVKDRMMSNIGQVEALLKYMDFGVQEENEKELEGYVKHANDVVKQEFFGNKVTTSNMETEAKTEELTEDEMPVSIIKLPEMRHDVLGLDHKGIMLKILTKMRKSKQAWEQHQQQALNDKPLEYAEQVTDTAAITTTSTVSQLSKINDKLAKAAENSEKFEAFLAKRRERKNTPERKKYRATDHVFDGGNHDSQDNEVILSPRQRQLYEAQDFLHEEADDKKT